MLQLSRVAPVKCQLVMVNLKVVEYLDPQIKALWYPREPDTKRTKVKNPSHKTTVLYLRTFAGTSGTSVITKRLDPVRPSASFKNYAACG